MVCYFTFVLAILGIVFGVKGRKLAQPDQKGLATAGFVLGIIGTVIGALGIICVVCAVGIFSAAGTGRYAELTRCDSEKGFCKALFCSAPFLQPAQEAFYDSCIFPVG
mgnify:FL=1